MSDRNECCQAVAAVQSLTMCSSPEQARSFCIRALLKFVLRLAGEQNAERFADRSRISNSETDVLKGHHQVNAEESVS